MMTAANTQPRYPEGFLDFRGRLLWEEPFYEWQNKKTGYYLVGFIFIGLFFLLTFVMVLQGRPEGSIVLLLIGVPAVLFILWTRFLLPIRIFENGIEYGSALPLLVGNLIVFLPWEECKYFKDYSTSYYFADRYQRKSVIINKELPGAIDAVGMIRPRIDLVKQYIFPNSGSID
jgi:hypothetical protein